MNHSTKLIINTIASYGRIIVNMIVTLISTRLALKYLGAEDFGLYNLIAGVVVMLSFFNGALMISSQRYFSICIGEKNQDELHKYFNASLGIHILLGLVIGLLLVIAIPFLFGGLLNIPDEKQGVAVAVYGIMVLSSMITVGTIPFSAIMNAHEDMAQMAVIDIAYCIGKLLAALVLMVVSSHLLEVYATVLLLAVFSKMFLEIIWSGKMYPETRIVRHYLFASKKCREMLGFVGWNTVGSVAMIFRNQGVAVVLNVFFGTIVNAAYGIANQVNALVLSFASTISTVFTPTIIQAKGAGDEKRMLDTAVFSSKLSFLLSSVMALPILLFIRELLALWLSDYPDYTLQFCQYIIFTFLVQQTYPGINRVIYATGRIRDYQLVVAVLLIFIIPVGSLLFYLGCEPYAIVLVMLISQALTLLTTTYYATKYCKFDGKKFLLTSAFIPFVLFGGCLLMAQKIELLFSDRSIAFIIVFSMAAVGLYSATYFFIVLTKQEQKYLTDILIKFKSKI